MIDNTQFYREGSGDSTILPSNPAIPMIRQQVAQDQQKREAQANAVASQLQKINFDKTRNADLPDLMAGYNDIKDTYNQSLATQDPAQKVALQNQLAQKQMLLQQHIANSQQALEHERIIGNLSLNPNAHLKDDFSDNYNKLTGLPLSSADYQKQAGYFNSPFVQQGVDLNANTQNMLKASLTPTDNGYTTGTLPGGIKQVYKNVGNDLDQGKMMQHTLDQMSGKDGKAFTSALIKGYGSSTDAPATITPNSLNTLYGNQGWAQGLAKPDANTQIPTNDPIAAAHNYVQKQYALHKDDLTASPEAVATQWPQRTAPLTAFEQWKIAHGVGDAAPNQMTPEQTLISNMKSQIPGSGEKFMSLAPQDQYSKTPEYPTGKPLIQFDSKTGDHIFQFPPQQAVDPVQTKATGQITMVPKAAAKVYIIDPKSPNYMADVAQMAKEQNIDLSRLNTVEALKGGHGQIDPATIKGASKIKGTNLKLY